MMPSRYGLKSLTRVVLVSLGNTQCMHAPIGTGRTVDTLCHTSMESARLVEASAVESHYEPCKECYALEDSD